MHYYGTMIIIGIVYPAVLNFMEMYKKGFSYFEELINYSDLIYTWAGLINVLMQNSGKASEGSGPYKFECKLLMALIMIQ